MWCIVMSTCAIVRMIANHLPKSRGSRREYVVAEHFATKIYFFNACMTVINPALLVKLYNTRTHL